MPGPAFGPAVAYGAKSIAIPAWTKFVGTSVATDYITDKIQDLTGDDTDKQLKNQAYNQWYNGLNRQAQLYRAELNMVDPVYGANKGSEQQQNYLAQLTSQHPFKEVKYAI